MWQDKKFKKTQENANTELFNLKNMVGEEATKGHNQSRVGQLCVCNI